MYSFKADIIAGKLGGAGIVFPYDVRQEFGTGGQVKIKANFDGVGYRGSLAPMGGGTHGLVIHWGWVRDSNLKLVLTK